ncbi:Sec-independent protein translocase protein TatB [Myxococcota bacterium]|nr:Sec-independent protein translocase protein TatB [Myxococcota bacterium]
MLNIGLSEMLVIAILAIVFIGPDDLPEMMRFLGRQYAKLRRASDELRNAFQIEVDRSDAEKRADEIRKRREELLAKRKALAEQTLTAPRPTQADQTPELMTPTAQSAPAPSAAAQSAAPDIFPRGPGLDDDDAPRSPPLETP